MTGIENFETELLQLAVRYVRTPEGAEKYGVPIGSPITADIIAKAKAAGKTAAVPEDKDFAKKSGGKFMAGTISGQAAAAKTAPKPQAAKPLNLKVKPKPSISGNKHFSVGKGKFSAPNGSKLIRPAGQPGLAYVVTPDGKVYAFTEGGEVPIPKVLEAAYKAKFNADFEGDENYAVEEFEASSASFEMKDMKVGSTLTDAEGAPQFTKLADDSWEHVDLGVKLKDEDLQDLYDSGELIPSPDDTDNAAAEETFQDTEAKNFSEMTKEETTAALDAMKPGQKVTIDNMGTPTVYTKADEGSTWTNDSKGIEVKSTSSILAFSKNKMKLGADPEPEYDPLDGASKDPLDANPQKVIGDQPDAAWIESAAPGSQLEYTNKAGSTTTWTKDETGENWENELGGKMTAESFQNTIDVTNFEGMKIKKLGKGQAAPTPEPEPVVEKTLEQKVTDPEDQDTLFFQGYQMTFTDESGMWNGEDGDGSFTLGDGEMKKALADGYVTEKAEDFDPSVNDLGPKSTVDSTIKILDAAKTGDQVHPTSNNLTMTKGEDGSWTSDITGASLSAQELADLFYGDLVGGPAEKPAKKPLDQMSKEELDTELAEGSISFKKYKELTGDQNAAPPTLQDAIDDDDQNILDAIPDTPEYPDDLETPDDLDEFDRADDINEAYSAELPENAVEIDNTNPPEIAEGDQIIEVTKKGTKLISTKVSGDGYDMITPEGMTLPIDANDVFNLSPKGNKFYHVPAAKPEVAPEAKQWKVGDEITSLEEYASIPVNAKLQYAKKDGTFSYYGALGGDMILTPAGNQMAVSKLSWALGNGKVKVHELPDAPAANAPETPQLADGDKIESLDQLDALPTGSIVSMVDKDGKFLNDAIKQENGTWKAPDDDPTWPGLEFAKSDMVQAIKTKNGGVFYADQTPDAPAAPEAPATAQKAELEIGGAVVAAEQLQEALDSLEAHSSFHVAYGLKGLDENNPLSDPALHPELKNMAMDAHPDMKAKPAVVQFLKDKLGVKDPEPDWEEALMEAAPKITIGSKTPKSKGVQGMDGGAYTAADIQDAINLLEAYPGKLFKSELSKKGNPLGELDPTALIGIHKDKLVAKQLYIDLLKTKLINQETQVKKNYVQSVDEFGKLPVGTSVVYDAKNLTQHWTKINDAQWQQDDASEADVADGFHIADPSAFEPSIKLGKLYIDKLPDVVPEYAKAPDAVKEKEKTQFDIADFDTPEKLNTVPNGTQLTYNEAGDGQIIAQKEGDNLWVVYLGDLGSKINSWSSNGMLSQVNAAKGENIEWQFKDISDEQPSFNANEPFAIIPGKYTTEAGKAFMVVNADGSGTQYSPSGGQLDLTAEKVKKNFDAGMSKYQGLVEDSELPTKTAAKKTTKKPAVVGDIADGTYFAGSPQDAKTSVYEVSGDQVKVFHPVEGLTSTTGVKIGSAPNQAWVDQAGTGATVYYPSLHKDGSYYYAVKYTKNSSGTWNAVFNGSTAGGSEAFEENASALPHMWGGIVEGHGLQAPASIDKAKLNTLFLKGGITDEFGNSVLPKNYSGSLSFFGKKTTIPALMKFDAWLKDFPADQITNQVIFENAKTNGVSYESELFTKWRVAQGISKNISKEEIKDTLRSAIADLIADADKEIPDAEPAKIFQWDEMGAAVMSLELASHASTGYDKKLQAQFIKLASKQIGDGKIIGQHWAQMDEYKRASWIEAFMSGDFAGMYKLEVQAAANAGATHNSGYLHPGFPDNTDTHLILWAPAVAGEISALVTVPGDWSKQGLTPSDEEVSNYLIKAQMQNPTYLSMEERRKWVTAHKNKSKSSVDKLSATAALRKKNGEAELSAQPEWTENLTPAKSYTDMFLSTQTPTTGWNGTKATDYLEDNSDNAELMKSYEAAKATYGDGWAGKIDAVQSYFKGLLEAETAKANKVYYKKTPNQTVKKGTHPIFEYDDFNGNGPIGNHYFFKPSPQGDAYRSQAEHLGHEFGWKFGFKTAGSQLMELDGKYGQLQKDLGSVSSLAQFDLSKLNASQIADIGREHVLDWFLDNDDTHSDNMQVLPDGSIVGIDKGRAFKHFGKWQGLNPSAMNSNAQTIYSKLFTAIQSGKLKKEDVDAAYLQIQKRALQMSKVSDATITDMLAEGMKNRKIWDVSYKIDGKAVGNNLEGLTVAVLDRKNKLPQQIEQMWAKVYKDAGFGDLPEPPKAALGTDHHSGLNEAHFHENAFKVGAGGVSTLLGGDFSQTGAAIAWSTVNKDGSKEMYTQVELNHVADGEVYGKLQKMNPEATTGSSDPTTFDADEYGAFITRDYYRAMATLAKHNDDKAFNQDRIKDYENAKLRVSKDLTAIQQQTLPVPNSDGLVKFPSGAMVPIQQQGQYRQMLEFYQGKEAAMDAAINSQADFPASFKTKFEAYPLKAQGKTYTNSGKDAQLTELANGTYLYSDPSSAYTVFADSVPEMIEQGGWQELAGPPEGPKSFGGATVQLVNSTFEAKGSWDADTGQIATGTANVGSWTKGSEYKITLPTGETIFFRNRAKTNTLHSQYGRLTVKVPNATSAQDYAAGVERAQDWMSNYLGLDLNGADEESAELVYWKQMLPTLTRRVHKSGSKYQKALKAVETKANELGISLDDFPFKFGQSASVTEQNEFYRKVWGDQFGKDKIDKLISEQGYLPSYEATDIHTKDAVQGRPFWKRFDIDLAELLKSNPNAFVASHNTSGKDAPKNVSVSGVHLSTEERIRFFGGVAGGSSSSDQQMGTGGQDQFTRIWNKADAQGYDYVYHPSVLLHTNTRFFHNDAFGAEASEKGNANPDPMDWWKNKTSNSGSLGGGNQLNIRWASGWMNSLEMVVFDDAADRDYAIQKLKQAGLDMIRGLPVEDRLVMRQNRAAAVAKLRAQWQKEAGL